jgi:hypothetical protein
MCNKDEDRKGGSGIMYPNYRENYDEKDKKQNNLKYLYLFIFIFVMLFIWTVVIKMGFLKK